MKLKFQVASAHGKGYLKTVNPKPSIIMTFEQTDTLIDNYFGEEISEYELLYTVEAACQEQTGGSVSFLKAYFADGIERRDAGRIECALVLAGLLGKDRQLLGLYESLLLADWHHSHEDIVASLEAEGNACNRPSASSFPIWHTTAIIPFTGSCSTPSANWHRSNSRKSTKR